MRPVARPVIAPAEQVLAGGADLIATLAPVERSPCRAQIAGTMPNVGDQVVLQLTDARDVAVRSQNTLVGQVSNPRPELIEHLERRRGMTTAVVAALRPGLSQPNV